jgi:uncharacterized protein
MVHFSKAGKENTQDTLRIAKNEALNRGIRFVLVASTVGDTGHAAARLFQGSSVQVIVVTHNSGFKEPGAQEFDEKTREEITSLGGIVYTGTHVLRGLGAALRTRYNFSHEQVVADTLRMFGQGIKVCVEIAAMAADAGLIPAGDVIAVGGTGRGADTAAVVAADSSNRFFYIKVREILAKPAEF